ncbi:hypothetical protein HQ529_05595 [Candidatus Woesearchaeota archaeon]|nr:hypothetical protein [Candidatus Woesearchaeota archaeon]
MGFNKKAFWGMEFTGQTIFWVILGAVLMVLVGILWLYMSNNLDIFERLI